MPSDYRTVRLQQGLRGKNTTRRVEIFLPNRRSDPLQLSHPHACNFALCLSYLLTCILVVLKKIENRIGFYEDAIASMKHINAMNATIRILTHKGLSVSVL